MDNIFQEHGCDSKEEYIRGIAEEHGVPDDVAFNLANLLGDDELFDGFVSAMQDAELMDW